MDHKVNIPSCYRVPFIVNLLALLCLAVLIALGAYVNQEDYLGRGYFSPWFSRRQGRCKQLERGVHCHRHRRWPVALMGVF